jgi:hypothetical protein
MNRHSFYRFLLASIVLFSTYSFFFVNLESKRLQSIKPTNTAIYQTKPETEKDPTPERTIPLPDFSILEKALELAKKFL